VALFAAGVLIPARDCAVTPSEDARKRCSGLPPERTPPP
jgi:hypothetical protein